LCNSQCKKKKTKNKKIKLFKICCFFFIFSRPFDFCFCFFENFFNLKYKNKFFKNNNNMSTAPKWMSDVFERHQKEIPSPADVTILLANGILSIDDFLSLSKDDLVELKIQLGSRNRILPVIADEKVRMIAVIAAEKEAGSKAQQQQEQVGAGGGGSGAAAGGQVTASTKFNAVSFDAQVMDCCYSTDGKYIAIGTGDDKKLTLLSSNGAKIFDKTHPNSVFSVCFSPDSQQVVTGCRDKVVRVYSVSGGGNLLRELKGHSAYVNSVAYSADAKMIASGSSDKTMRIWNSASGQETATFTLGGSVCGVSFSNDSPTTRVATASTDGMITIFDIQNRRVLKDKKVHSYALRLSFSPDSRFILSGGNKGDIVISKGDSLEEVKKISLPSTPYIQSVSFSPSGDKFAVGTNQTKSVHIFETSTGAELKCIKEHSGNVTSVSFAPDGKHLISGSSDNSVRCHVV
jgi:hypothetical protein